MKAPFPWFGGKSRAASVVWEALGDPSHYVEPFAGSLAVLLNRPHESGRPYYAETVNDADGLLVNAWRSIQWHPEETAQHANWPVMEADIHARHCALMKWRQEQNLERLMGSPEWCDPKMAGWWLYGLSAWIGSGWCGGGPWGVDDTGKINKDVDGLVSRKMPHLRSNGQGVHSPVYRNRLVEWFSELSRRLRYVRIVNGDWSRVVTTGASKILNVRISQGVCGVFLDPPYASTAKRKDNLYAVDSLSVAHDVREWALSHGEDAAYRIVVAGFEGEHGDAFQRAGWREVEWFTNGFLTGGMGNTRKNGIHQQRRERLWCSPTCLQPQSIVHASSLLESCGPLDVR